MLRTNLGPLDEVAPEIVALRRQRARGATIDRWFVRVAFGSIALGVGWSVVTMVATARQIDPNRIAFRSSESVTVALAAGEAIEIYMDPTTTEWMPDVLPSDFACTVSSPTGEPVATRRIDQRRRIDGGSRAWSIATLTASTGGSHSIDCRRYDTTLFLVHPGPTDVTEWLDPWSGMLIYWLLCWVATILVIPGATHFWELSASRTRWWRPPRRVRGPSDRPPFVPWY